jgi:hypothetical protein
MIVSRKSSQDTGGFVIGTYDDISVVAVGGLADVIGVVGVTGVTGVIGERGV